MADENSLSTMIQLNQYSVLNTHSDALRYHGQYRKFNANWTILNLLNSKLVITSPL